MRSQTRLPSFTAGADAAFQASGRRQVANLSVPLLSFLFVLLLFASGVSRVAQAQVPAAPSAITVAIFPDPSKPSMPDDMWQALVASLYDELASGSPDLRGLPAQAVIRANAASIPVSIVRGDRIAPGISVANSITVYLHGECKTTPVPKSSSFGQNTPWQSQALGWVLIDDGHIEPFVHVDCTRLGQMLGLQGIGRSREQRNELMAVAVTRVIVHEWIHIATQNSHHAKSGIAKAEFGVSDLLEHRPKPAHRKTVRSVSKENESGF